MKNIARARGFTLIELMITVAVMAILATIAMGQYRSYILRANRAEAKIALLQIQTAQEKYFLQNSKYVKTNVLLSAVPASGGLNIPATTPNGAYQITLDGSADTTVYIATATAIGPQATNDTACPLFTIDNTGARTPADSTGCWK